MVWQTYSYDCETPGAYFGAKKACKPLHVQLNLATNEIDIINASLAFYKQLSVKAELFTLEGKRMSIQQEQISTVPQDGMIKAFDLIVPTKIKEVYVVRLTLIDAQHKVKDINSYMRTPSSKEDFKGLNSLSNAVVKLSRIHLNRIGDQVNGHIRVSNRSDVPAYGVKLGCKDNVTEEPILPCFFSDGYFLLMPGESRTLSFHYKISEKQKGVFYVEGYNM